MWPLINGRVEVWRTENEVLEIPKTLFETKIYDNCQHDSRWKKTKNIWAFFENKIKMYSSPTVDAQEQTRPYISLLHFIKLKFVFLNFYYEIDTNFDSYTYLSTQELFKNRSNFLLWNIFFFLQLSLRFLQSLWREHMKKTGTKKERRKGSVVWSQGTVLVLFWFETTLNSNKWK